MKLRELINHLEVLEARHSPDIPVFLAYECSDYSGTYPIEYSDIKFKLFYAADYPDRLEIGLM
jgi:hypothetical protein